MLPRLGSTNGLTANATRTRRSNATGYERSSVPGSAFCSVFLLTPQAGPPALSTTNSDDRVVLVDFCARVRGINHVGALGALKILSDMGRFAIEHPEAEHEDHRDERERREERRPASEHLASAERGVVDHRVAELLEDGHQRVQHVEVVEELVGTELFFTVSTGMITGEE